MPITEKQRRHLRKMAHSLKPVVIVGQSGLTESVVAEISNALDHHELIKVRINAGDKAARQAMIDEITAKTEADFVLSIGHIAGFYRPADKPIIQLPRF